MKGVDFGMLPDLAIPCREKKLYEKTSEQVVELFRVSASVGCCCPGAAQMPALRQRHDALCAKVSAGSAM